jgi:hypothetical protein
VPSTFGSRILGDEDQEAKGEARVLGPSRVWSQSSQEALECGVASPWSPSLPQRDAR